MRRGLLALALALSACSAPLPGTDRLDAGTAYLRALRPRTGATVYARRPRLQWFSSDITSEYRVEFFRDRGCTQPLGAVDTATTEALPTADLPPGRVFWRVRPRRGSALGGWTSPLSWFIAGAGDNGDPRAARLGWRGRLQFDADGDGLADLVFRDGTVYRSLGARFETRPYTTLPRASTFAIAPVGDVNGDGYLDIAVADSSIRAVWIYHGPLAPGVAVPARTIPNPGGGDTQFPYTNRGRDLVAGDMDGDGFDDIVAVGQRGDGFGTRAWRFRGASAGVAQAPSDVWESTAGSRAQSLPAASADLDGDGLDETLFLDGVGADLPPFHGVFATILRGSPNGWISPPAFAVHASLNFAQTRGAAFGDFGGRGVGGVALKVPGDPEDCIDRRPDPLATPDDALAAICEVGATTFADELDAGDIDGDGRADLVVQFDGSLTGVDPTPRTTARLYRASSEGAPEPLARPADIAAGPDRVGLADVDGDGRMDAIGTALTTTGRRVALVYRGTPTGFAAPERVP